MAVSENADVGEVERLREQVARLQSVEDDCKKIRKELEFEHERFLAILQAMDDAVFMIGSQFVIQYANPAAERVFGAIDTRACYEYFNDRDSVCPWCRSEFVLGGRSIRWVWTSPKNHRSYDAFETPLKNPDGTVSKLHILHDITEHKTIENKLRDSEHRCRMLVEMMNEGLFEYNEELKIVYANDKLCEILGYLREQVVGTALFDLVEGSNRSKMEEEIARRRDGERGNYEIVLKGKDGRRICCLISSSPVLGPDGVFRGGIATVTDISHLKEAQRLLRESEEKYRMIFNNSPLAVFYFDSEGVIKACNSSCLKMMDLSESEIVGCDLFSLLKDEEIRNVVSRCLSGDACSYEGEYRSASSQKTIHIRAHYAPIKLKKGELLGGVAIVEDITGQKRAAEQVEESEKRLRCLSAQLLSAQEEERKRIAGELHDSIGSYLSAIKFSVEDILHHAERGVVGMASMEALVSIAQSAIEEVRRIITDLRPSILDDLGIVATIGWFCRQFEAVYSGVRIEKRIGIKEDEVPEALKIVIFRVIQEALNNAAKHSRAETVNVSFALHEGAIELVIRDNGVGFDPDAVRKAHKGGLGLTSMKERVKLSGGSFSIRSQPGKGTSIEASWLAGSLRE